MKGEGRKWPKNTHTKKVKIEKGRKRVKFQGRKWTKGGREKEANKRREGRGPRGIKRTRYRSN